MSQQTPEDPARSVNPEKRKKGIIKILFFLLLIAFTGYLIHTQSQTKEIFELIKNIDRTFLYGAVFCMLIYLFTNAAVIYLIAHNVSARIHFLSAFYLGCAGQYYGMITPMGSGTQPAQIMLLKNKYGIDYSRGTTITIKQFIVYQIAVSGVALGMFLANYRFMVTNYSSYLFFIYLGLISHVVFSLLLVLLSYTDTMKSLILFGSERLKKIPLFKGMDTSSLGQKLDEYSRSMHEIKDNKKIMLIIILLSLVQVIAYFSVTYFIYRAFGLKEYSFMDLFSVQSIVYIVVSFIPTPGNALASESGFYVLLKPFFPQAVMIYAVLFWRFITYYANILFNGSVLVIMKLAEVIHRRLTGNGA